MKGSIDQFLHFANHDMYQEQPDISLFGGVIFFRCLWNLTTAFNAGSASVFTVWSLRGCRMRKSPTLAAHILFTLAWRQNQLLFSPWFHCNNHRLFPFGATASLAGTFAADKSVGQLNQIGKPVDAISVGHSLSDFAQHGAGRNPRDAQVLGCSKRGNTAFVRSHQVDRAVLL